MSLITSINQSFAGSSNKQFYLELNVLKGTEYHR